MTLFEELKWRGIIKDISSPELEKKLNEGGLTFYIGTDPTADSLHVGHLSSFLISKRLKDAGHHPILLVGGGTGMIGDPRPTTERAMIGKEEVTKNFNSLKKQVEEIIKATGLEDVKNKLIRNLSRGYKQRVSMAGALVGKPEILILDEPTVGLDPKQIIEIRELIKSLGKDHTVIISSHILSEISQICEKVIIINKGEIVAIDTPENLEKLVNENNSIIVTVEDKENKMPELSEKVEEISKVELVKDNEDGTKQYVVFPKDNIDLRKTLFDVLPKENITIFELRKSEATLEEAFIKLINKNEKGGKENVDNN